MDRSDTEPTPTIIAYRRPNGAVLCVSCFDAGEYRTGAELTEADDDAHADCDACHRPIVDEDAETEEQANAAIAAYARAHGPEVAA
jgi:hypothetical protein